MLPEEKLAHYKETLSEAIENLKAKVNKLRLETVPNCDDEALLIDIAKRVRALKLALMTENLSE
jgi:hypothetical protein